MAFRSLQIPLILFVPEKAPKTEVLFLPSQLSPIDKKELSPIDKKEGVHPPQKETNYPIQLEGLVNTI